MNNRCFYVTVFCVICRNCMSFTRFKKKKNIYYSIYFSYFKSTLMLKNESNIYFKNSFVKASTGSTGFALFLLLTCTSCTSCTVPVFLLCATSMLNNHRFLHFHSPWIRLRIRERLLNLLFRLEFHR